MGKICKHHNDYRAEELIRSLDNSPLDGEFEFAFEEEEPYYETVDPETIDALIEYQTAEDILSDKERDAYVRDILDSLTPREAKTLRLRYGVQISNELDHTLEEVGKMMYVTRERIRQIEAKALRKMRHPSRSTRLKMYVYDGVGEQSHWEIMNTPPPPFDPDFDDVRRHRKEMEEWYEMVKKAKMRLEAIKEFIKSGKSNYKGDVDEWLEL